MRERAVVDDRSQGREGRDGHAHRNRIFEHTAELKEEAQDLASSIKDISADVSVMLKEQLDQRPYAVLGVAAAFGYVIGGGLPSRITRAGLSIGLRLGMGMLMRQFVEGQMSAMTSGGGESGQVEGFGQGGS
ncbi:MAG: hypothetical protein M9894_08390 [Planctomycetes bacterium]|nr:hypothetical protein [Planctomycetota bacterium]